MMQILNWAADAVLVLLLGATLVMALRLDRALRTVGGDRAAFEALIGNLGAATDAVRIGIQALRGEADRAADQIERRSAEADKMATDLSFLIEAADRAGARLEGRVAVSPKPPAPPPSRLANAARALRRSRPYERARREEDAAPAPVLPDTASSANAAPEDAVPGHTAPGSAAAQDTAAETLAVDAGPAFREPDGFGDGTPGALRRLAGITTRRRVLAENGDVPVPSRRERDLPAATRPVPGEVSGEMPDAVPIKLVG